MIFKNCELLVVLLMFVVNELQKCCHKGIIVSRKEGTENLKILLKITCLKL